MTMITLSIRRGWLTCRASCIRILKQTQNPANITNRYEENSFILYSHIKVQQMIIIWNELDITNIVPILHMIWHIFTEYVIIIFYPHSKSGWYHGINPFSVIPSVRPSKYFVAIISASNGWIDFKFGVWPHVDWIYVVCYFGCSLISTSCTVGLFSTFPFPLYGLKEDFFSTQTSQLPIDGFISNLACGFIQMGQMKCAIFFALRYLLHSTETRATSCISKQLC